jgi:acyl-CoA reductase LuxC
LAPVPEATVLSKRQAALLRGAAQWRDPDSMVRRRAREAMREGEWPPQVVEAALDSVLADADEQLRTWHAPESELNVLAILPGNIVGPAIATAFCAALAGANLMLKSSSRELHLADILAEQFEELGPPVAGTLSPMRWSGGDTDFEARVFPQAQRIVVFGDDTTIEDVKRRAPGGTHVVGYGSAYSLGFVPAACDLAIAADAAALDVALFDQRGCLSPQTIYVEGDEARSILFAHGLSRALGELGERLPRAKAGAAEQAAVAEFVRRLMVRALPPRTHALGTVFIGRQAGGGVADYVVGVEPFSGPQCAGFGRIVIVKPCVDAAQAAAAASTLRHHLDSVGIAGQSTATLHQLFGSAGALRVCALGEMQRPPFGYRPRVVDFSLLASA